MCKSVKKSIRAVFLVVAAVTLTACGGGGSTEGGGGGGTVINKPAPSSEAISSQASSSTPFASSNGQSSDSAASESTPTLPANSSSLSFSSYTRSSRANSSQPTQNASSSAIFVDTDTTPPFNTYLLVYDITDSSITLIWDDASDDTGVMSYEIRRNGLLFATPEFHINRITDAGLSASTDYHYTIKSIDLAGNASDESPIFTIRTAQKQSSSSHSSNDASSSATNSSITSKSSSGNSTSSGSAKPTELRWSHPNTRVSGKYMELGEIGGYSIRYRKSNIGHYDYLTLTGNKITTLTSSDIPYDGVIEIATIDTDGLYSQYASIAPSN